MSSGTFNIVFGLGGIYYGFTSWAAMLGFSGNSLSELVARFIVMNGFATVAMLVGRGVDAMVAKTSPTTYFQSAGVGAGVLYISYLLAPRVLGVVSAPWLAAIVLGWGTTLATVAIALALGVVFAVA